MRKREIAALLLMLAADRGTKWLAPRLPAEGMELIPGVLGLRYAENRGMAFSLFSGHPLVLGLFSLAAALVMAWVLWKKPLDRLSRAGLLLMLGGAAGNLPDRLFLGYVTDWIEFLFVQFAIFNLADTCLTVGCGLLIVSLLRPEKPRGGEPPAADPAGQG